MELGKIRNIRNLMRICCFGIDLTFVTVIILTGLVRPNSTTHFVQHLPPRPHHSASHRTILHECGTVSGFVLNSVQLEANKTGVGEELIRPAPALALLNTREYGGYSGTRRSAESRTHHTRQRLDGNRATQRHSETDQRSWRPSPEQPGL